MLSVVKIRHRKNPNRKNKCITPLLFSHINEESGRFFQEREKENEQTREKEALIKMMQLEDLAEKKAKIYSRLLTDVHLAEEMNGLSLRHEKRKELLTKLAYGKCKEKQNGGGMSAMNGQKE